MLHWRRLLSLLFLGVLLTLPSRLMAGSISIGTLSFIYSDTNGLPGFQVSNYTGPAASCSATPATGPGTFCYPVTTTLLLDAVSLTVNYSSNGGPQQQIVTKVPGADDGDFSPGNNGLGTYGVDYGDPSVAFEIPIASTLNGGPATILSATLTGTFTPAGPLSLTDGSTYFSSGTFSGTLNGLDCSLDSVSCIIASTDLTTDPAGASGGPGGGGNTIPEPATYWLMLGGGSILLLLRRYRPVPN